MKLFVMAVVFYGALCGLHCVGSLLKIRPLSLYRFLSFEHDAELSRGKDYIPPYIKTETKVELKLDCCLLSFDCSLQTTPPLLRFTMFAKTPWPNVRGWLFDAQQFNFSLSAFINGR
jgi:hypothetical protein